MSKSLEDYLDADDVRSLDSSSLEAGTNYEDIKKDLTEVESDIVISRKMALVNDAIDQIGFTWFHAKLFCTAGFGYSLDSQMAMIQSACSTMMLKQFGGSYPWATQISFFALITGSIFWGFSGDLIGRKIAFNSSLILTAIFGFFAGGMGSYPTYCIFMFLANFAAGGNLALDVAVFLEFLPFKYQYLNTTMALWWGFGQTVETLVAWAVIPNNSCDSADYCPSHLNKGWRYNWYINSGIVLAVGLFRIFLLRLDETPKFLVSVGRDEEAVETLQKLASKYNRQCSLTIQQLKNCGELTQESYSATKDGFDLKVIFRVIKKNIGILFQNRKVGFSTSLIFISWGFIGLCYGTFYNFLYIYISSHGGDISGSTYYVYRNSAIANFVGIFGPILAGWIILIPRVGRRGCMIFGALSSMAILFGYTTVRTTAGDAGFGSATYFFINIYYGCLYAYTPEILPAQARGTGVALALVCCRIFGSFSPVVYYYGAQSGSSIPIWVCGAIIGCLAVVSAFFPFEPTKLRSV